MNLYLIEQDERCNYDTYDSAVVAAPSPDRARFTHPNGWKPYDETAAEDDGWAYRYGSWATHPDKVTVTLIGKAAKGIEPGVICASFNAG